ncbi:MAG: DUF255 domain-containing protein [Saprospiraceae bacterium]|nr:DUF255 domain-containing protein [Saprospiraceae bacterium]
MKKFLIGGALVLVAIVAYAFIAPNANISNPITVADDEIKWLTWEEAIKAAEENPKKIFIDVYTDWCGWCKKMDQTTFKDAAVVKYMNENFYAVKFDAEQKGEVQYKGYTLKFIASGRRGVHELAYSLLDGRLGYPSYVYLDENQDRITISPGFKTADTFVKEIKWIGGDHYKTQTYQEFMSKAD